MSVDGAAKGGKRKAALVAAIATTVAAALLVGVLMTPWRTAFRAPPLAGIGGPFRLTDEASRRVTDADFRGRWVLLYFGYTHCPDVCPTAVNAMAGAIEALGPARDKIQTLFITLDPERDTPAVLKDYTSAFQAGIVGLTGTPDEIAKVAAAYHISYRKRLIPDDNDYSIDHSSVIFLLDPAGRTVSLFSHELSPEQLARRLEEAIQ